MTAILPAPVLHVISDAFGPLLVFRDPAKASAHLDELTPAERAGVVLAAYVLAETRTVEMTA
jgi:hypothetical protein